MAGMVYNTVVIPDEMVVKAFKAAMEVQPKLKCCQLCVEKNEDCTRCNRLGIPITKTSYGCRFHKTNEQAVVEHIRAERLRGARVTERIRNKLDLMDNFNCAANMICVDVMEMYQREYDRLVAKVGDDEKKYLKTHRNMGRFMKAYKEIKKALQDIRSMHVNFVEYWDKEMYSDLAGNLDVKSYDNHQYNGGLTVAINMLVQDRAKYLAEIVEHMNELPSEELYEDTDVKRYLIKI